MVFCLWQLCEFVYWWLVPHPAVFVICLYVCMYVCVYVCMYVCVNFPCIVNFLCILFLVYQRKNFITCNASYTGCPTRYRTRHFFNNFTANEDFGFQFLRQGPNAGLAGRNTNVLLFKFRCHILIGVRIIKEMPGSVTSGTPYVYILTFKLVLQ